MRRILFLIAAAALSAGLVHAQDAENVGNSAQLSIIPRIDVNPYIPFDDGSGEFSLSNSSLNTLLEGEIGSFSYSMAAQWLSASPSDLYSNIWHADECDFLKWAYLTWQPESVGLSLGKQFINVGSYEYEGYDWDMHWDMASTMWNEYQVYQWGAALNWDYGDESTLILQACSSPFSEHPFDDGLATYTLYSSRQRGDFSWLFSASLLGYEPSKYIKMLNYSMAYPLSDRWNVSYEYGYRWSKPLHLREFTSICTVGYDPSDNLSLTLKYGYESCRPVDGVTGELFSVPEGWFLGLAAHYFPIDNLRLHGVLAYNPAYCGLSVNVGATYNFTINIK